MKMQKALATARIRLGEGDYAGAEKAARNLLADTGVPDSVRGGALTVLGKALFLDNRFASGQAYVLGNRLVPGGALFKDRRAHLKAEEARHKALRQAAAALREAAGLGGSSGLEASLFLAEELYEGGRIDEAHGGSTPPTRSSDRSPPSPAPPPSGAA